MDKDNLDRPSLHYPHTSPSIVYLQNNIFQANTCLDHINDLLGIYKEAVKKVLFHSQSFQIMSEIIIEQIIKMNFSVMDFGKKVGLIALRLHQTLQGFQPFNF